ncbi:hypothetical protein HMPREF1988_02160 [Porphyromonas gingivalis F0185]|nr:hypothetical protein HMPREF1553_01929 [Porphyromonas gingivalis F0568]ERJ80967.1 hypothetical protein HMPREF1988_02160 [Porphyromonas gingivalis F0185]
MDSQRKGKTKLLKYDSPEQWERILSPHIYSAGAGYPLYRQSTL